MFLLSFNIVVLCASLMVAINIRQGWLDRVVAYHKNKFYNEVLNYGPIDLEATIKRAPPGYTDSPSWNIDSAMQLLVLISESETAIPVKLALRRMLKPTRRLMMSKQKSYKFFPSLAKESANNFYYDMDSDEDYNEDDNMADFPDDEAVIVVSNPVEARLPSAQISVKLLKDILEARAQAGRVMPSTPKTPFPWKPANKTISEKPTESAHDVVVATVSVAVTNGGDAPTGAGDSPTGGAEGPAGGGNTTVNDGNVPTGGGATTAAEGSATTAPAPS